LQLRVAPRKQTGFKCPGRNTFALAAALAVKSGNNTIKIIYQDMFTALADATNDLSMPCHE